MEGISRLLENPHPGEEMLFLLEIWILQNVREIRIFADGITEFPHSLQPAKY